MDREHDADGEEPVTALALTLQAEPSSVPVIRTAVREHARQVGADPAAVALAVSEAVSNVVLHAYEPGAEGDVHVVARYDEELHRLAVEVRDEGRGLTPRTDSPGMGLGLPLMVAMTAAVEIDPTATGTVTRMFFTCEGELRRSLRSEVLRRLED